MGDLQIDGIGAGGLNYKPYQTPGMSRAQPNVPQSSNIFQSEAPSSLTNGDESLQVKPQKKVWGQPVAPTVTETPKATPIAEPTKQMEELTLNKPGGPSKFGPQTATNIQPAA